MKLSIAIGCSTLFIVGTASLLFGSHIIVRLFGAAAIGIVLFGILGEFLVTGQIRTNGRQIVCTENRAVYWTNVWLYTIFVTAMLIGMILVACGFIPVQAPRG